jgi:hypothetical protein
MKQIPSRSSLRGASLNQYLRLNAKKETYIASMGKATLIIPTAKNAVVTMTEQSNVIMHGDLELFRDGMLLVGL